MRLSALHENPCRNRRQMQSFLPSENWFPPSLYYHVRLQATLSRMHIHIISISCEFVTKPTTVALSQIIRISQRDTILHLQVSHCVVASEGPAHASNTLFLLRASLTRLTVSFSRSPFVALAFRRKCDVSCGLIKIADQKTATLRLV